MLILEHLKAFYKKIFRTKVVLQIQGWDVCFSAQIAGYAKKMILSSKNIFLAQIYACSYLKHVLVSSREFFEVF